MRDQRAPDVSDGTIGTIKTATDRAIEAIEAAELMFADEMGATLGLSPAAKVALLVKVTAAIQSALVEERAESCERAH